MDYFKIPASELGKGSKIPVYPLGDSGEVFYELALEMVNTIKAHNAAGEKTVFICPVGPVGQYPVFVRLVNRDRISLKDCWFINMDEYLNDDGTYIDIDSPLSFRGFMRDNVYTKIDPELLMPESQRVFPDPADPGKVDRLIEELGGVDVAFGGIGINGHLAFNEAQPELSPEEFAALGTRTLTLTPETKTANAIGDRGGAIIAMPNKAVTIGIKQILGARRVRLGVFRDWHRGVVRQAAYGEVSAAFPVTLLQNHPDAAIFANSTASPSRSDMEKLLLTNGRVFTGGALEDAEVLLCGGRIAAVGAGLERRGAISVDLRGNILSPGFIDIHTHGGCGVDINAAAREDYEKLSRFYASQGVTGFLASILTDTVEATERAIDAAVDFIENPIAGREVPGHTPRRALPLREVQGRDAARAAPGGRRGALPPLPAPREGQRALHDRRARGARGAGHAREDQRRVRPRHRPLRRRLRDGRSPPSTPAWRAARTPSTS